MVVVSRVPMDMPDPLQKRLSISPEKLILAGKTYSLESACARTFLFVGDVVAWSHLPHLCIINGLRKMADANDLKTAKAYSTRFSGELNPSALQDFQDNWTGVLGDVRRRQNAGRIWLNVPDDAGKPVSVISFWAHSHQINRRHIARVRDTFNAQSGVYVDFYDKPHTLYVRARPGHARC